MIFHDQIRTDFLFPANRKSGLCTFSSFEMVTIQGKLSRLRELLEKEETGFRMSQRVQFDWLQSIKAQLDLYEDDQSSSQNKRPSLDFSADPPASEVLQTDDLLPIANLTTVAEDRAKQSAEPANDEDSESLTTFATPMGRCATLPIFSVQNGDIGMSSPNSTVKFVDDDSLLLDGSDQEEDETETTELKEPIPFTVNGSMRELTQSAASFREKWKEMLQMKKACTNVPKKQAAIFAFEDDDGVPEGYQISDDDSSREEDDDIYERNPVEIHGKMIPIWARGDQLLRQLRRQKRIDPDSIFSGFTADCSLPDIFNVQKPRWEKRSDSGWWDSDRVTEEEVAQFKAALGIE